jgi:hypothetical protein
MLGGSLVQVRPIRFDARGVVLGVDNAFDESKFTEPEVRAFLLAELAAHFGRNVDLDLQRIARGSTEAPMSLSGQEDLARAERRRGKAEDARSRRAVLDALDALGAKIQRVKVVDEE